MQVIYWLGKGVAPGDLVTGLCRSSAKHGVLVDPGHSDPALSNRPSPLTYSPFGHIRGRRMMRLKVSNIY